MVEQSRNSVVMRKDIVKLIFNRSNNNEAV